MGYYRINLNTAKPTPVQLQHPISGKIALRSVEFTIGWQNITAGEIITIANLGTRVVTRVTIPEGLYNFEKFKGFIDGLNYDGLVITASETTGKIRFDTGIKWQVGVSENLRTMLGLESKYIQGRFTAASPMNFALAKSLHVHLAELNKEVNFYGESNTGFESTYLDTVPIGDGKFGTHIVHHFGEPVWKQLSNDVNTLTASIHDTQGEAITNEFPFVLNFEVDKN